MSETLTRTPETGEHLLEAHEHQLLPVRAETQAKAEKDPAVSAVEARQEIQAAATEANPLEQLNAAEKAPSAVQPSVINRQLKQITLRRELKQLRRKETPPERALSRLIHQPAVRVISETAAKTVSRPSGLLGGGLLAFTGTSGYLYLAKHFGYSYNYLIFLLLMAAGFALGLVLELLVHLATAHRRHND